MINLYQDQKKVVEKKEGEGVNAPYEGRELTLNPFKSKIFPIKIEKCKGLKIVTPKQMLQILPKLSDK